MRFIQKIFLALIFFSVASPSLAADTDGKESEQAEEIKFVENLANTFINDIF